MKNRKGITLISLVITIVVLVILSGVAIYLALGNNGIINKAEQAKNETTKQAATEKMNLKITNMQMETYGKEQRMPTLQEFSDGLCEDDEIQYVELQSKKVGSLNKIEIGEAESIFTKLKEYPYEFEINSSLQLASIDGIQVATVPENDGDTIVSMTKSELQNLIDTSINLKTNIYSKTEQRIGTWINGKPLYQKVYEIITPATINTVANVGDLPENYETIFITNAFIISDYGISNFSGTAGALDRIWIRTNLDSSNSNKIALQVGYEGYTSKTAYITVQYTKTTD